MIGVCIKYFHHNYGGVLQAYATTAYLESQGWEYELVQYQKKRTLLQKVRSLPRLLNGVLLNDKYESLLKKIGEKQHPQFRADNQIRRQAFDGFIKQYFTKESPVFVGYDSLCAGARRYTSVLTGSDQLWSPAGLPTNYYNLMFVPDDIQKVSWASSFGVSTIPWYQRRRTAQYLNRIECISMRENRGAQIVKELTDREVPVLMDPVFVFDGEQWDALIPPQQPEWDSYIFCYFLGNNPEHRKAAKRLSEQTGLKIVTLRHLDRYVDEDENFGDYAPYDVDPARFLNILRNATYVCTDSFHGTAFSILSEKKFIVFNRYANTSSTSKNSRIDSLCENLGIQNRRYTNADEIYEKITQDIDYALVRERIQPYREKTKQFLAAALR